MSESTEQSPTRTPDPNWPPSDCRMCRRCNTILSTRCAYIRDTADDPWRGDGPTRKWRVYGGPLDGLMVNGPVVGPDGSRPEGEGSCTLVRSKIRREGDVLYATNWRWDLTVCGYVFTYNSWMQFPVEAAQSEETPHE